MGLSYTQAPHLTNDEIEFLLRDAKVARFCSLNEDGTIHVAPVWFKYENARISITTPVASRKARNVRRNNNVTVLVDLEGPPAKGVLIYGNAEMEDLNDKLLPEAISFFEKYIPKDKVTGYTKELFKLTNWVRIGVKPSRIASFDYAKDDAYRKAAHG